MGGPTWNYHHNTIIITTTLKHKDTIIPFGLDRRLPLDTLFFVLEEDFRFFPTGNDPNNADDYRARMVKMHSKARRQTNGKSKHEPTKM